jgi:hypothetical protein
LFIVRQVSPAAGRSRNEIFRKIGMVPVGTDFAPLFYASA